MKKKIKDEEKLKHKKKIQHRKRMDEIEQLEFRLPPPQVRHEAGNYTLDISVPQFTLDVAGKILLEGASLHLTEGRRYGLIGKNGIGKTTLLYELARKEINGMNTKPQILMIE